MHFSSTNVILLYSDHRHDSAIMWPSLGRVNARIQINRVARNRLTHFKFEYCAGATACRGWREGER